MRSLEKSTQTTAKIETAWMTEPVMIRSRVNFWAGSAAVSLMHLFLRLPDAPKPID